MRNILYRGKTKTGRWAYGSLILAGSYCCILEREENVHPSDYPYLDDELGWIDGKATPVIPETVGRMVRGFSRTDNINSMIFQGDIVALYDKIGNPRKPNAIVVDECTLTENGLGRWFPQDTVDVKVIGNAYDNPELVGEKYANRYIDRLKDEQY